MSNITSTYYIIQPGGRSKMLTLEGDNPQNDQAALEMFEQYVMGRLKACWNHTKKQKFVRLEKTVSAEMVSIPLQLTETERVSDSIYDPNPGVTMVVYDMINIDIAQDQIKEAKDRL